MAAPRDSQPAKGRDALWTASALAGTLKRTSLLEQSSDLAPFHLHHTFLIFFYYDLLGTGSRDNSALLGKEAAHLVGGSHSRLRGPCRRRQQPRSAIGPAAEPRDRAGETGARRVADEEDGRR